MVDKLLGNALLGSKLWLLNYEACRINGTIIIISCKGAFWIPHAGHTPLTGPSYANDHIHSWSAIFVFMYSCSLCFLMNFLACHSSSRVTCLEGLLQAFGGFRLVFLLFWRFRLHDPDRDLSLTEVFDRLGWHGVRLMSVVQIWACWIDSPWLSRRNSNTLWDADWSEPCRCKERWPFQFQFQSFIFATFPIYTKHWDNIIGDYVSLTS